MKKILVQQQIEITSKSRQRVEVDWRSTSMDMIIVDPRETPTKKTQIMTSNNHG